MKFKRIVLLDSSCYVLPLIEYFTLFGTMAGLSWVLLLLASLVLGLPVDTSNSKRQDVTTYDFIVVGCGASGLTVAARLSELSDVTVLCIEAGSL